MSLSSAASSALLAPRLEPDAGWDECLLTEADLPALVAIEQRAYPYPWTEGNLRDSIRAGHTVLGLRCAGHLVAYAILMPAPDEVHLLNLTVVPSCHRQGWGRHALQAAMRIAATQLQAQAMLLEVRPSNGPALALYEALGFCQIGRRRHYYPAPGGREDALVLQRALP